MALPPSTANWHWKNKNVNRWAKEWFERELTTISITGDKEGEVVSVSSVTDVDGDVELGQRKSKLITIYDCKISLDWQGTTSEGTEVKGRLTIPEVSHEITLDGLSSYSYEWRLSTKRTPEVEAIFDLVRSRLPTALEAKFAEFPVAIIDTHGKDLTVSGQPSRVGTPANAPGPAATATSAPSTSTPVPPVQPKKTEQKALNTKTVTVQSTFQASADDLFSLLTDEKRIPAWTRAPAKSNATAEGEYSLFGGGVKGKYISLTPSTEIVQSWALSSPTWPAGHTGTLTTTLEQSTDSTTVIFSLAGVPTGMEEEIRKNIEGYYIHGFKSIGYVQLILEPSAPSPPRKPQVSKRSPQSTATSASFIPAISVAVLILVAAFSIPYLSSPASSK